MSLPVLNRNTRSRWSSLTVTNLVPVLSTCTRTHQCWYQCTNCHHFALTMNTYPALMPTLVRMHAYTPRHALGHGPRAGQRGRAGRTRPPPTPPTRTCVHARALPAHLYAVRHRLGLGQVEQVCVQLHGEGDGGRGGGGVGGGVPVLEEALWRAMAANGSSWRGAGALGPRLKLLSRSHGLLALRLAIAIHKTHTHTRTFWSVEMTVSKGAL